MRKSLTLIILSLMIIVVASCTTVTDAPYFEPVSSLHIPDDVRVVAFGEATHGNHEFKELASDVFKRLVTDYGFRAFATEAPLSTAMAINEYIVYGIGTARTAVMQTGWVHDFQETIDLVEWMREFNLTAAAGETLRFYGYDIQDTNVAWSRYLAFVQRVDANKAVRDEAAIGSIPRADELLGFERYVILEDIKHIDNAVIEMRQSESRYVARTSQSEFDVALRNLLITQWSLEMVILLGDVTIAPSDYDWGYILESQSGFVESWNFRDKRMYENVKWIVEQEENRGHGRVFVFGHNGHIKKDLYMDVLRPMGTYLDAYFGDRYFAIGTEFYMSTFMAIQPVGWLREGTLANDTGELINKFVLHDIDVGVLDIRRHMDASGSMDEILNSEQLMGMVGATFSPEWPLSASQATVVPVSSYDAIIFVRNATPARFAD